MQQADASISRLAPAGPGRAGPWLSTVESSSWCLEAPVTGHDMHLATSNEERAMLSSAGAVGGAGAPVRRQVGAIGSAGIAIKTAAHGAKPRCSLQ